jgi:cytoskeleton protein RodZ|tara:strand:+ start:437 stop:1438 length:1002 start_codon:yes stop_codon:yes gene_type:complete
MKQEVNILKNEDDKSVDVADEANLVVGPGHILKEARELRGLSEQQVANKLNFRIRLVQDIEINVFDRSLPEAFNRGYLKNYAQLVHVSEVVVLNSYDQLAEAQSQCAGMQSFSKGTEKQAEHKMLMWITYLILAILFTATVVWWLQTPSEQPEPLITDSVETVTEQNSTVQSGTLVNENNLADSVIDQNVLTSPQLPNDVNDEIDTAPENVANRALVNAEVMPSIADSAPTKVNETVAGNVENKLDESIASLVANVVFTFSGDCWVNIYDATGERIAWGVKKSGYVMQISGQAPFSITLGKPELVQIDYNDVPVDMTAFNAGNIAKFSLPMVP